MTVILKYTITSIDVKEVDGATIDAEYGENASLVEFSGEIKAKKGDTSVACLVDVEKLEEPSKTGLEDEHIYKAIKISQEEFRARLIKDGKKVLACVHGFTVQPETIINGCVDIKNRENFDHNIIPVIWPSQGSILYNKEQDIAEQAAKAFGNMESVSEDISISLMCHSMGNYVLSLYAKGLDKEKLTPTYDCIFMVASDVWEEMFNERIINAGWWPLNSSDPFGDAGLKLVRLLKKDDSKVHIIHNEDDRALSASVFHNGGRSRLGRYGKIGQEERGRLHPECKDKLVDFDVKDIGLTTDTFLKHSYQTDKLIVDYYVDKM